MQKISSVIFVCLSAFIAVPAHADVYKWTDSNGQVHYGDKPMDSKESKNAKVLMATPSVKNSPVAKPKSRTLPDRDDSNEPARPAPHAMKPQAAPSPDDVRGGPGSAAEPAPMVPH